MLWPNGAVTRPPISSPYGPRKAPVAGASTFHRGCDFVGFGLVRAIAPGRVVQAGTPGGWGGGGIQVWIQHDGFLTRSMHLKNGSLPVRVGDYVEEGRILGVMGMTGNVSGVHLHLEVVVNGVQIDPVPFITQRIGGGSAAGGSGEDDMQADEREALLQIRDYLGARGGINTKTDDTVGAKINSIFAAVFNGGPSMRDNGRSISASLGGIAGAVQAVHDTVKAPVSRTVNGKVVQLSQIQDNADTNSMVRELRARPAAVVTAEQVKQIADAVVAAVGKPTATIDYAAIAKAVNDDAARRMVG